MDLHNGRKELAARYADWVIRWRWLVAAAAVIVAILAASGGRFIAFNNDYRVFFSKDNPQLQEFEKVQRTYTKVDNILFAVVPPDGDAFSAQMLAAIEELTAQSWHLPHAMRVDSVTNFQYTHAEGDDLVVQDLAEGSAEYNSEQLARVKQLALGEPALAGKLVNADGSIIGVNVTFQLPEKSMDEGPEAVAGARAMVANIEEKYGVKVHLTGTVMLFNAFFESSMNDMGTLVPIMYGIIILITFSLMRSFTATFTITVVIVLSILTAMGLAGYIGIKLTPPSSAAPTIIMTLAVANSIHILVTLFSGMRRQFDKIEALRESLRVNLGPISLTSATTAVGFLSMNFSDAPPMRDLGNITAMGVMAAFVLSVTLLPALMAVLPTRVRSKKNETAIDRAIDRLANFVVYRYKQVLVTGTLVAVTLLSLIPLNELDDNFVSYFDTSTSFRQDTDFINDNLSGIYQLQYSLDSGNSNGVSDPEFLGKVHGFAEWLRQQPEVRHVNTISDTFHRLNKNLHGDDPDYYRLPEKPDLAAQFLLLYELSLPYGLDMNNQLNVSKSSTQIVVTLNDMPSAQLRDIAERGTRWLRQNTGIEAYGVGPSIMFAYIAERNISSMLVGTLLATLVISVLITATLRSLRLGALSLIPNVLPASMAFGLWGLLVGEVNVAVSMVAGMALGIVVDDTVHFLSKYLRARREQGMDAEAAVRYAFSSVGVAILVTSIILIAGFMVLAQSTFGMNSNMAMLTAIAILMALVADFSLLPALLLWLDRHPQGQELGAADSDPLQKARAKTTDPILAQKKRESVSTSIALMAVLGAGVLPMQDAAAVTTQEKGLDIAREADRRDLGFIDARADLVMVLSNRYGEETERRMRSKTLEQEGDGDKVLIVFDNPRDVKGTAFLSFTHKAGPDDQWLHLPSLKRVKRISSSSKSGPFMGSEFAFEDMSSQEVEKYTYNYQRDESFDGREHFVIERDPVDPKSGYSHQEVWFDKDEYRIWKINFYDRKGDLLKTLSVSDYKQFLDQYWRANNWSMINHQTGKSTKLKFGSWTFRNGFSERDFTKNSLARIR